MCNNEKIKTEFKFTHTHSDTAGIYHKQILAKKLCLCESSLKTQMLHFPWSQERVWVQ